MRRSLPTLLLAVVLTACGGGSDPAPRTVTDALARVDRVLAVHDYAAARLALDDLVRRAAAARDAGQLSDARSDSIISAAARLAAALPHPAPTPSVTPTRAPQPEGDHKGKKKRGHDD